jgi:YVTN family beta-propeller protein
MNAGLTGCLMASGKAAAQSAETGYPTFLSPHASPIVKIDGHVYVANTPADTVDVIDAGSRNVVARVHVGIDPVSLAARPDGREVWVSNHVSDSVSVIDTDPASPAYLQVVATVQDFDPATRSTRFDEPVGIAFAGNDKAYVALSSENQVAVVNVAARQVENRLDITAQDPRAIVVSGDRLYVIPFESGNKTQISGCTGPLDGDLCTFDANEHVIENNNVLSRFAVVDIVKHPAVPDRDLYIFDTATDQLVDVVETLGTLLYGLTVDSRGRVYIAQTDARNDANGRAGTLGDGLEEMENRAFLNQITRLDCSEGACASPHFIELEPLPPAHPEAGMALATPFAVEVSDDDATLAVTAAGSDMFFTVDAASGEVLGRVEIGAVPRGIALESGESGGPVQAWVLNAAANSVSLVDLSDPGAPVVADTIILDDPTHPVVKRGRILFNDANASSTGTFSCESCHPDGGTDQLAWVLDTPECDLPGCDQIPPRITMPIRGLRDTTPYHWDGIPGDPYGGNNTSNIRGGDLPNCSVDEPESCTRVLVDGSLATTMCDVMNCGVNDEGKSGALTAAERDDMAMFLLSVPYPPAQRRAYTNVLSNTAVNGFRLFHIVGDFQGDPQPNVCGDCHRMPFWVSTNTPDTGMDAPTWRGAWDRWLILPQGRLNIIDFNFYRNIANAGAPEREMWRLSWSGRPHFDPVWNMVVEGSTGFDGAFARTVTLNRSTAEDAQADDLLDAMEQSAGGGGVVLRAEGVFIEDEIVTPVALLFDQRTKGGSYLELPDGPGAFTRNELVQQAVEGGFIGTFTARPGPNTGLDHPQPAIWTLGYIEKQLGRQDFPTVFGDSPAITISGRHIREGAKIYIDGRRVPGTAICQGGELPGCLYEVVEVHLASLPSPNGMHFLQIQNPGGAFSNDFIFHSTGQGNDNCPDIPNPDQDDADGDGLGDRCDDDAFDFGINPGISGTWFDPAHDGEGWFVELLDENQALVYWFTYTPPAVGGERAQAWIGGIGRIEGSGIVVEAAESWISTGPPFGPDFDPERVSLSPWGKIVLSFSGCDSGVMHYRSDDPDYGNGSLDLVRVSRIDTLDCRAPDETPDPPTGESGVFPALSGAWYDPAHEGEGWLLEILPGQQALLAWFSYDPEGNQAWFLNVGTVQDDAITFDLSIPSGTDFGPTFDPEDVDRPPWGRAVFRFDGCNSGSMSYESPREGYGSGELEMTRLTQLWGLECSP